MKELSRRKPKAHIHPARSKGETMSVLGKILMVAITVTISAHDVAWAGRSTGPIVKDPVLIPIEIESNLTDYILPDFKVRSVSVEATSAALYVDIPNLWHVLVEIENIGGNKGISSLDFPRPARMSVRVDISLCSARNNGRDPDFSCDGWEFFSTELEVEVPRAGKTVWVGFTKFFGKVPQAVYVYANDRDQTQDPYDELDSPECINNQAYLRIIWDVTRSSYGRGYNGSHLWIWPNTEDTLIY